MAAVENDFSKGSVVRNILNLSIPMTMAQLVHVLYNVVDRIYIGYIPDEATLSLTGLGICLPVTMAVIAFANLFGMGGAPLCSIERGKGNEQEAEAIMGNSFTLMLIFGILLTAIGLMFKRPLLYLFGASDITYPYASAYMTIYILGSIFVMTGLGMNAFINSQGFARVGMMTVFLGAVTNIILDPIFIFRLHMGVQGAALATVISQFLSAVWIICFLTGKRAILKLRPSAMHLSGRRVKRITAMGTSSFMAGSQPFLGFNYGAGEYDRVKQAIRFISIVTISFTVVSWLAVSFFPVFFIKIFNHDEELIAAAIPAIRVYFFGFCMMSLQFSGQASFVGLGKAKQAAFFSIFRKVIIVLPLTLLLPHVGGLGVMGVFMAEPISNLVGGLACYGTMLHIVWPELSGKGEKNGAVK